MNVGLGFVKDFGYNLKEMLEEFKDKQKIKGNVDYITGGLIPMGLQRPFQHKNILFVGDAAVGTFPFSGQGIYRALLSGDIAGKCIAQNKANRYPHVINQKFGRWDVLGKIFIDFNCICRNISPRLVNKNLDLFIRYNSKMLH